MSIKIKTTFFNATCKIKKVLMSVRNKRQKDNTQHNVIIKLKVITSGKISDFAFQGGLKAVVWTDTIQTVMMFGAVIAVAILGTARVGGVAEVWRRNANTGRIEFFK